LEKIKQGKILARQKWFFWQLRSRGGGKDVYKKEWQN
jgi:hypothetical protein